MEQQIELCGLILDKIHIIQEIPHNQALDAELDRFLHAFQEIQQRPYESWDEFKEFITNNTTKTFHFDHYNQLPSPILIVLGIFLSELNLLYDFINLYNDIDIDYNENYKVAWKEIIDEKYAILSRNFGLPLPCMEGFIGDLEKDIDYIKKEPIRPVDMQPKIILSKSDFINDGGFSRHISENMTDYDIIGVTLSTFRTAICGTYSNCKVDSEIIRQSYNLNNYLTYLEYIQFYEKYKHLDVDKVKQLIEDTIVELDVSTIPIGKVCCPQNIMKGGRKTKRNRKVNRRKTKRNKQNRRK